MARDWPANDIKKKLRRPINTNKKRTRNPSLRIVSWEKIRSQSLPNTNHLFSLSGFFLSGEYIVSDCVCVGAMMCMWRIIFRAFVRT